MEGVLVTLVVSVLGVEGVVVLGGAFEGRASSGKQNMDGVVCLI